MLEKKRASNIHIWAALSVGLFAGASIFMLILTSWMLGVYWAGVFSIGLAMSQQMFTIGCFCVRRYQSSDVMECYNFSTYFSARVITCILMILFGCIWIFIGGCNSGVSISRTNALVFLWLLLYKTSEAISDVFGGRYQQKGFYDVSCKVLFFKTLLALLFFFLGMYITKSLSWALFLLFITHFILTIIFDGKMFARFDMRLRDFRVKHSFLLLFSCLPLAIDSILRMYINNGSKFAIDSIMDKESVAVFSVLFMISFIMSVFSEFILNPYVTTLAEAFNSKKFDRIQSIIKRQLFVILGFGIIGVLISYFCGVEILSFIFHVNLISYRLDLCVLFLGGILLALFYLTQLLLIILRKQLWCIPGVLIASMFVFLFAKKMVGMLGIMGGALVYMIAMAIMLVFGMSFVFVFYRRKIGNEM